MSCPPPRPHARWGLDLKLVLSHASLTVPTVDTDYRALYPRPAGSGACRILAPTRWILHTIYRPDHVRTILFIMLLSMLVLLHDPIVIDLVQI